MWNVIWGFGGDIIERTGQLGRTQWLLIFAAIVVVGFVCMRGFGSRSTY